MRRDAALTRPDAAWQTGGMEPSSRTATLHVRVTPAVHDTLKAIAINELRPVTTMAAILINEGLAARSREKGET